MAHRLERYDRNVVRDDYRDDSSAGYGKPSAVSFKGYRRCARVYCDRRTHLLVRSLQKIKTHRSRTLADASPAQFATDQIANQKSTATDAKQRPSFPIGNSMSRQSDSNRRPADYKSAALPAELCRHLPGKILSDAASASLFLYGFSIRPHLTPLEASFWTRPEHTGGNSHRFGASATTHRLRTWSGDCICWSNAERMGARV
jgi:hypothetical protein